MLDAMQLFEHPLGREPDVGSAEVRARMRSGSR
jgi:hypothetical protein